MYNVPVDSIVYYTDDAEHNVTALVSGLTQLTENYPPVYAGDVVERYVYDVYGEAKTFNGDYSYSYGTAPFDDSLYHNTVLYKGMSRDVESGLDLSRNRVYSYNYRTWMQRDPIGYGDGTNLYRSFGSNPVNESDPSGEFGFFGGFFLGFLGGAAIDIVSQVASGLAEGKGWDAIKDVDLKQAAVAGVTAGLVVGIAAGLLTADPTLLVLAAPTMGQVFGAVAAGGFMGTMVGRSLDHVVNKTPTNLGQDVLASGQAAVTCTATMGVGIVAQKVFGKVAPAVGRGIQRLFGSKSTIQRNALQGSEWERTVETGLRNTQNDVVNQITVKTPAGTRTRLDFMGVDAETRNIALTEAKSSSTAPLTRNQTIAFPEIEKDGATVVGKGKPPFVGGTLIPPTKVSIVRPGG